jgi:DSF synthase
MLGLPEIHFNLFPGMGAASFLERRIGASRTEQFLARGEQHSAEKLAELSLIHVVAEDGAGERAVYDYIRESESHRAGLDAIWRAMGEVNPVAREELQRIVDLWVERAMRIGEPELRTMARLVAAQSRVARRGAKERAIGSLPETDSGSESYFEEARHAHGTL